MIGSSFNKSSLGIATANNFGDYYKEVLAVGKNIDAVVKINTNLSDILTLAGDTDMPDAALVGKNIDEVKAVAGEIGAVQVLGAIVTVMQNLETNLAKITTVADDTVALNSVYADKATLDSIYADKAALDSLFSDKATLDALGANIVGLKDIATYMTDLQNIYANMTTLIDIASNMQDILDAAINAGVSEDNALQSAVYSENSARTAQQLVIGAYPEAPTLTADGRILSEGSLYYNTTTRQVLVYNGNTWVTGIGFNGQVVASFNNRLGAVVLTKADVDSAVGFITIDTTNANNIASGTLDRARLPVEIDANTTGSANKLDGLDSTQLVRSDQDDTLNGNYTVTGNAIVQGDLTVQGATTTVESTVVQIADKNIELGVTATPTDTTANGGGITVKGTTDKTMYWDLASQTWVFSHDLTTNLKGNADSATKLKTARTIQLSGDVTGTVSFNGTTDIDIVATVQDDSHNHIIANVDGLQTKLDSMDTDRTDLHTEIDTTQTSAGLNADGTYITKTGSNYINSSVSIDGAVDLLDGALKDEETTRMAEDSAINVRVDNINIVAGTSNDTYTANTSASYISSATDLVDADNKLDSQAKINADNIVSETNRAIKTENTLQTNIDTTNTDMVTKYVNKTTTTTQSMAADLSVPNLATNGLVDGRDVSVDGTKLDGIESGATADQTASEILTAIKTVDGSGSGLDADLLDGRDSKQFVQSQTVITDSSNTNNKWYKIARLAGGNANKQFRLDYQGHIGFSSDNYEAGGTIFCETDNDSNPDNNISVRVFQYANTLNGIGVVKVSDYVWDLYVEVGVFFGMIVSAFQSDSATTTLYKDNYNSTTIPSGLISKEIYTVWNSNNDGAGSGLDADTVDGYDINAIAKKTDYATSTVGGTVKARLSGSNLYITIDGSNA